LPFNLAHTHTHTSIYGPLDFVQDYPGEPVPKPVWILLKQETVSGNGISWAMCKSAPCPRQITMPAPHHSVFYKPDAIPAAQPTASKHWRQFSHHSQNIICSEFIQCVWESIYRVNCSHIIRMIDNPDCKILLVIHLSR